MNEQNLAKQFYRDLVECLTEPRRFFGIRYSQISLSYALAFGILINWVAAFFDWLTRIIHHETLLDGLLKMREKLQGLPMWKSLPSDIWAQNPDHTSLFPAWLAEVFGLALSPFQSLLHFLIRGMVLWLGIYLLLPREPISIDGVSVTRDPPDLAFAIKLTALCAAPNIVGSILGFLPLSLGAFIAGIYTFALTMIALMTRYQVSGLRAFSMIILPGLMAVFAIGCILSVFGALLFGSMAALFGAFQ